MAVTLTGLAVVWGCGNLTFTGVAISGTTGKMQSYDFTRDGDDEPLLDENGETVGMAAFNLKKTLDINVIPSNATVIATGQANMDAMLPAKGTTITVSDSDAGTAGTTRIEASHSGKYYCMSAKVNRTNRGPASINIQMVAYDANDITVATS